MQGALDVTVINGHNMTVSVPIYPFVFNTYSRYDPSMRHLDDKEQISRIVMSDNSMSFSKTFESHLTRHNVSFSETGFTWTIIYDGITKNLHFGIVIPTQSKLSFEGDICKQDLINYKRYDTRELPGQRKIGYPMLTFNLSGNTHQLYLPYFYDSQFFIHKQNGEICTRISTETASTKELNISLFQNNKNPKVKYLSLYPGLDMTLKKWKKKYKEQSLAYNISLYYQEEHKKEAYDVYVDFQWASEDELEQFCPIFEQNIRKYSHDFAEKLRIESFIFCKNLYLNDINRKVPAAFSNGRIFLDISEFDNDRYFHHEVYHSISTSEADCDLFSNLMVDYKIVKQQIDSKLIIEDQVNRVKEAILKKGVEIQWSDYIHEYPNVSEIISRADTSYHGLTGIQPNNNVVNIIGTQNSGLMLLAAILNCSPNISVHEDSKIRMHIHKKGPDTEWFFDHPIIVYERPSLKGDTTLVADLKSGYLRRTASKLIYITRHPLTYCLSVPGKICNNLELWEKEQISFYNFFCYYPAQMKLHVRYEDILLSEQTVKQVFDFIGIDFHIQYLRYGEFKQYPDITSESELFSKGMIEPEAVDRRPLTDKGLNNWWESRKESELISILGYDNFSLGE